MKKVKKVCKKKCKRCKGVACPNYSKVVVNYDEYYEGILHSKSIKFTENKSKRIV